jgi:hypothetical protein
LFLFAKNRHQNSRTKFKIAKNFLITKKKRIVILPSTFSLSPTLQDFFINHKSINVSTMCGFKPFMTLWHYLIHPRKSSKPYYLTPFPCQLIWTWKGTLTLPSQLFFKYLVKTSTSFTIIFISSLTSFHNFPFKVMINDHKIKKIKIIKLWKYIP